MQNGYGFVHYALTVDGIQSAVNAVAAVHQVTVDRVTYDCSLSHALERIVGQEVVTAINSSTAANPARIVISPDVLDRLMLTNQLPSPSNAMKATTPLSLGMESPPPNSGSQKSSPTNYSHHQLPPLPPHHHPVSQHPIYHPFPSNVQPEDEKNDQTFGNWRTNSSDNNFFGIADLQKSQSSEFNYSVTTTSSLSSTLEYYGGKNSQQNSALHSRNNSYQGTGIANFSERLSMSDSSASELGFEELSINDNYSRGSAKASPSASSLRYKSNEDAHSMGSNISIGSLGSLTPELPLSMQFNTDSKLRMSNQDPSFQGTRF